MIETSDYFETPQRTERLQLLMHLVSNAEEIPYLRAPQGAGKTRFARELAARFKDDYTVVWLVAGAGHSLRDQLVGELGLPLADSNWLAEVVEHHPDRPLLLIVDDAERLQLAEVADLLDLAQTGARLLLVGTGDLAQAKGNWDLQFVDLPPFTESETRAFLERQGRLEPGEAGARAVAALHRTSEGLPGLLLDALDTLPVELPEPSSPVTPRRRSRWGLIAGGVAVIGLVGLVLYFQDTINAWFEPAPVINAPPVESLRDELSEPASGASAPERPEFKSQVIVAAEPGAEQKKAPVVSGHQAAAPVAASSKSVEVTPAGPAEASVADSAAEAPDPVLDAIIDEAIKAAAQPPQSEAPPVPTGPAVSAGTQVSAEKPAATPDSAEMPPSPQKATRVSAVAAPERSPAKPATEAAPPSKQATPRSPAVQPVKAKVRTPAGGLAWLRTQPDSAYTLQLVGARDRQSISRFVRRHRIKQPHAVFERDLNGKPWYSLVAGSYPDRQAAVAARARLPQSIAKTGVWPRTFASIRQQIKANH